MARAAEVDLAGVGELTHVVVSPDAPDAMARHIEQAVALGTQLVFAPAQQLTSLPDSLSSPPGWTPPGWCSATTTR